MQWFWCCWIMYYFVVTARRAFSRFLLFYNYVFVLMLVLFCLALWSSHVGKRELVAVLAFCLCVHVVCFTLYYSPLGAGGEMQTLIVVPPGNLFIFSYFHFSYSHSSGKLFFDSVFISPQKRCFDCLLCIASQRRTRKLLTLTLIVPVVDGGHGCNLPYTLSRVYKCLKGVRSLFWYPVFAAYFCDLYLHTLWKGK